MLTDYIKTGEAPWRIQEVERGMMSVEGLSLGDTILVFKYYKHSLLDLLNEYPDFPVVEIKKILRYTGEAVKELHDKGWIHASMIPCDCDIDSS
jgi:serine/threonine protein kinase